jgi:glycosyltransferase involved in cell wall biosynthesis
MKKILFITDTWSENHNKDGVVTWIRNIKKELEKKGHRVTVVHPGLFLNIPMPTYKSIRISLFAKEKIKKIILDGHFDIVHISTEGTLGLAGRSICKKNNIKYSTYYHSKFPEYVHMRLRLDFVKKITHDYLRWFHKNGEALMLSTETLKIDLEEKGFKNIMVNPLGVDISLFKRNKKAKSLSHIKGPIFIYLGRVAPEKNIEAFLKCNLPGTKVVIGDGPDKKKLEKKYKEGVLFLGKKNSHEVVDILSQGDVLVFPSKTDTFGLVILEAMACGLPVAAYDVLGPRDIITSGFDGYVGENLEENAMKCLELKRENCILTAERFSWQKTAETFLKHNELFS